MLSIATSYNEQVQASMKVDKAEISRKAIGSDVRKLFGYLTNCSIGIYTCGGQYEPSCWG